MFLSGTSVIDEIQPNYVKFRIECNRNIFGWGKFLWKRRKCFIKYIMMKEGILWNETGYFTSDNIISLH